jgi:hypothetical protein
VPAGTTLSWIINLIIYDASGAITFNGLQPANPAWTLNDEGSGYGALAFQGFFDLPNGIRRDSNSADFQTTVWCSL